MDSSESRHAERLAAILATLEHSCFQDPWNEAMLHDQIHGSLILLLDAEGEIGTSETFSENKIIGYLIATIQPECELLRIGILPEFRNQKYAQKLMQEFHSRAPDRILLEVGSKNESAIRLYERLGYRQLTVRKRYYRDGSDALVLELRQSQNA